jgi:hypothetical protein
MEIANASALVLMLVEHNQEYPEPIRRQLLEAVCEIADACLNTIDERGRLAADRCLRREISACASRVEKHLLSGELTEGFLVAFDAFQRAAATPAASAGFGLG